ncbi:MAG: response regulator transcription factor [Chloroflexi bacterium]|nr:response regulator transcription factor [Chloroflexota bacterium]
MSIRLIVVDDHFRVHQGLEALEDVFDDLTIVGHASNGGEAIELVAQLRPDVVLMDVIMPVMDGIEATQRIHSRFPSIKVLALSSFQDTESVKAMIKAGAVGYVLKNATIDDLAHTIRAAHAGTIVLSAEFVSMLLNTPAPADDTRARSSTDFGLTQREREILKQVVAGKNNSEIAAMLVISISTVKFHISSIFNKLDVTNRVEAARAALEHNLLD